MGEKKKNWRKGICGIALLFAGMGAFGVETAEAAGFAQEMQVQIGVFDAAEVKLDYEQKEGKYDISAEVRTANLFDAELYQTYTKSRNHIRTKKIFYDAAGKAYKRISTKDKKQNTVAITGVPQSADAADLQTVFAGLIGSFRRTKSCATVREVYDGKKHYRVIARDEGTESRYFELPGRTENAYKCSIYIENLKDNNDNILWDVSAEKPIWLWIGVDAAADLPYVLEIRIDSTPLGALKVTPKTLEIK